MKTSRNDKINEADTKKTNVNWLGILLNIAVVGAFLLAVLAFFSNPLQAQIDRQGTEISELRNKMSEQGESLARIEGQLSILISDSAETVDQAIVVRANDFLIESISLTTELKLNDIVLNGPEESKQIIATGIEGKEYSVEELEDERIIFSYMQDGYSIVFCGQYNDNNHWDKECILNAFYDGKLSIATTALYDDGMRLSYSQIFADGQRWIYSERKTEQNVNVGDTWTYNKESDYMQSISLDAPDENDLIIPDSFVKELESLPLSKYHGNTSEGFYNDSSGEAYLISYYNDGKIKTLYQGGFKDGQFEDSTEKGWEIASDREKNVNYLYYRGKFKGGVTDANHTSKPVVEHNITIDRIMEIIKGTPFETEVVQSDFIKPVDDDE